MSQLLKKNNIFNCEYLLRPHGKLCPGTPREYISNSQRYKGFDIEQYCRAIEPYPDSFFDLVIIDGAQRYTCMKQAIPKVRSGGYLLLDDSDLPEHLRNVRLLEGWKRKDFFSPKPYVAGMRLLSPTTIWQKPFNQN